MYKRVTPASLFIIKVKYILLLKGNHSLLFIIKPLQIKKMFFKKKSSLKQDGEKSYY